MISSQQLEHWLAGAPETEHLEFKEAKQQYDSTKLLRYCVALANEGGGYLVLGSVTNRHAGWLALWRSRILGKSRQSFLRLYASGLMFTSCNIQMAACWFSKFPHARSASRCITTVPI